MTLFFCLYILSDDISRQLELINNDKKGDAVPFNISSKGGISL